MLHPTCFLYDDDDNDDDDEGDVDDNHDGDDGDDCDTLETPNNFLTSEHPHHDVQT